MKLRRWLSRTRKTRGGCRGVQRRPRWETLEKRMVLSHSVFDNEAYLPDLGISVEQLDEYGNEYCVLASTPTMGPHESTGVNGPVAATLPLSETFLLHSNPTASHTIYLDFDGHVTSGTIWNSGFNGGSDIVTPAYDLDGNAASFSDSELQRIQWIWQRVVEDYSPFDVDVTTQEPAVSSLIKNGGGDSEWGVRVVIGGSSSDWYGSSAGGVAYVGSFNWSSDTPAFVFESAVGQRQRKVHRRGDQSRNGTHVGVGPRRKNISVGKLLFRSG